jgi:hypothetical protein
LESIFLFQMCLKNTILRRVLPRSVKKLLRSYLAKRPDLPPIPAFGFNAHEFTIYSQHGEDGLIDYIFTKIGTRSRKFVEFGCGDGRECNTANLSINGKWSGLLMDCDFENAQAARQFYENKLETGQQVKVLQMEITAENINEILSKSEFHGEIDLLSIDIDGNDYWVWKALGEIQPRVVVIEYNASYGKLRSIAVQYDAGFDYLAKHPTGFYHGASIVALTKLADEKGYALVGCDRSGTNAFFVLRNELDGLQDLKPEHAYFPSASRPKWLGPEGQYMMVRHLPFVEI